MKRAPNIVLFFTDQQRFDTIHALNNPVIRTPNLDRLCREGAAFTSAYSPCPVCVPARCCMKYGRYPVHTGCYDNGDPMPIDGRPSLMDALSAAGYRTHGIGKCHFTPDPDALRGFQSREMQEEGRRVTDDYIRYLRDAGYGELIEPHGVRGEMYYVPQVSLLPPRLHPTQWVGDRSVAFVEGQAQGDRPWFLFSSFIHPHPPFAPPSPWHKLYRAPLMPLPKAPPDAEALHTHVNRVQNRYKYRDQGIDLNLLRGMKAHYYACISFIDFQVGRVLDALAATGRLDDTLVLFTSDHGEHLGDYRCFGKRSMHDTCARVPMLARLPGRFDGGRVCDTPVSLVDVAPTLLATASADGACMQTDGVDLKEILEGSATRDTVFAQYQRAGHAIYTAVTPAWKYAYSAADDLEFLFDRVADPAETRNRAGNVFLKDAVAQMRATLQEFLRAGGEAPALDGDGWRRYPRQALPADPDQGLIVQDPAGFKLELAGYTEMLSAEC
ncbi:MAG: sulfatase-like hydrolase/transferase [Kiritimatiellae bacterium]|nr:sulfatase-like hydrolase/transferase [Kiritimatiellia bacterium]